MVPFSSSVFTSSSALVLGLILYYIPFLGRVMAVWSQGVYSCAVFLVQRAVGSSGIRKLSPRTNQTLLIFIYFFCHDGKKESAADLNIQGHFQLTHMMSINQSEASKAMTTFSGNYLKSLGVCVNSRPTGIVMWWIISEIISL